MSKMLKYWLYRFLYDIPHPEEIRELRKLYFIEGKVIRMVPKVDLVIKLYANFGLEVASDRASLSSRLVKTTVWKFYRRMKKLQKQQGMV